MSRQPAKKQTIRRQATRSHVAAFAAAGAAVALALAVWLPGLSSTPDRIVFVGEQQGSWDLWWMRGDGSGVARLTTTPIDERAPALSPDRIRIAYSTSDGALAIMTTADRQVTHVPLEAGRYSNPSWSPDGRHVVFTSYTLSAEGEDSSLWVYEPGQKAARQLLKQDGAQDYARYSPDGRTLIYSSSGAATVFGFGYAILQQLWTLSLVTGRVEQLLLARGKDTQPAWSPDGRSLVFVSERDGVPQLWRVDADGNGSKRLTEGSQAASHPVWSPDGGRVLFVVSDGISSTLATVDAGGGASQPLRVGNSEVINLRDPHWR